MENKSKDSTYAKRYKKKVATRAIMGVAVVVIASLVIISYLGSLAGNYTVQLSRDNRQLTLADNLGFKNSSTRLRATKIEGVYPCTLDDMPSDEILDANDSASHNGYKVGVENGAYLAYTFYLKNIGNVAMNYYVKINIDEMDKFNSDGKTLALDEILRVMIYENDVYTSGGELKDSHNKTIYAKNFDISDDPYDRAGIINGEQIDNRECPSYYSEDYLTCGGREQSRTTAFLDNQTIIQYRNTIDVSVVRRYTVVMWLEGYDPDCKAETPEGSGLILSMDLEGID